MDNQTTIYILGTIVIIETIFMMINQKQVKTQDFLIHVMAKALKENNVHVDGLTIFERDGDEDD